MTASARAGQRRRRRLLVPLVALGVAAAATGGAVAAGGLDLAVLTAQGAGSREPAGSAFTGETGSVTRGDLEGSTTATGTLRFADPTSVTAGRSGVVTRMREPGTVVRLGEWLHEIDNVPVLLLHGSMPAWRELGSGMSDGPDVRQLEQSLHELGYLAEEPDDTFTWATTEAIMDWQEAHGLERTGRLPLGSVRFADGDVRVGNGTAQPGDQVGPGTAVFGATGTRQEVAVDLSLSDQQLGTVGTRVVVRLPDGSDAEGTIVSVGTPTEQDGSSGTPETVIPLVVELKEAGAADAFQEASVSVDLPSERREDVLSVPVGALLALSPEQFGVEVVAADGTTRKIPVETGMFAGGRVEISGDDVEAGQRVVVPQR